MNKPNMPFEYAKTFLAASTRDALVDHAFGDSEVFWLREGREVASGYMGRSSKSVSVNETKHFAATKFQDKEAEELDALGQRGHIDHNDAGDPRER